jgi:hypothetical protein
LLSKTVDVDGFEEIGPCASQLVYAEGSDGGLFAFPAVDGVVYR